MEITCIITDDEPMARKGLAAYVEKIGFLKLIDVCEDAVSLNDRLQVVKPQLLFLDIEMPYLSGLELVRSLKDPPKVIFTTAYEQYALDGFELDVLDYLLKPISFERFLKSANRALEYFQTVTKPEKDSMFVKVDGSLRRVLFTELLFAQGMENYVALHTVSGKLIVHSTLKAIESQLPPSFMQVHKSYIVNLAAVSTVTGNVLKVGTVEVPVSKGLKDEVLKRLVQ